MIRRIAGLISVLMFLVFYAGPSPIGAETRGGRAMNMEVKSTAFQEGAMIPKLYTCDGKDISPPLSWSGVPAEAKSIALIMDDPDAPRGTWVHWVLFNIPADNASLPESIPRTASLSNGAKHGNNSWRRPGYGGPCPPRGTHRYYFKVYALDTVLPLKTGSTKGQLLKAMEGHVLAEGQIMGKCSRK